MPSFSASVELLHGHLARRDAIVARIEQLLNCQKKPFEYQQDLLLQGRMFSECFVQAGTAPEGSGLNRWLEAQRLADGLEPRDKPGNDVIDPVQMLLRGFHFWQQTRWPGQKGRLRYAHNLFNLHIIRCLTLLTLRLWDDDKDGASERLAALQSILDALWQQSPADQPRLVRDVRWLLPVAMSPTTDSLAAYFVFAERIADTFSETDRVATQRAWVQSGAGHLCSQLRHLCVRRGVGLDDPDLVMLTRKSNALDVCLLMEGLVTLFHAYAQAVEAGDAPQRLHLATAICQGVSPDPELYLLRLDLLGPYTMIEERFVEAGADGSADYTHMGKRHLRLLEEYRILLAQLAPALLEDSRRCRPEAGAYAPYGALFGFASNILELLAFKTLVPEPVAPFSMEDAFSPGADDKRAWVNDWRKLPHVKPEVVAQYAYAEDFVQALHARIEAALEQRADAASGYPCGKLYINHNPTGAAALPIRHIVASASTWIEAGKATAQDAGNLLHCRMEGEFLASFETADGWVGVSKDLLTEVLGAGVDAALMDLPPATAALLAKMCPGLVAG